MHNHTLNKSRMHGLTALLALAIMTALVLAWAPQAYAANTTRTLSTTASAKTVQAANSTKVKSIPMYRLYNPKTEEHLYTKSLNEKRVLTMQKGWLFEGIAWYAPETSKTPVYRLYKNGAHHYTTSNNERNVLVNQRGWIDEGIGWYSDDAKKVPVYRVVKPGRPLVSAHHYTTSENENNTLIRSRGWKSEGVGWYATALGKKLKDGWIKQAGKWTYWLEGKQQKNKWIVTCQKPVAASSNGIQRYSLNGAGNPRTGFFKLSGASYYGIPNKFHVLCGKMDYDGDTKLVATKEGKLPTKAGWQWTTDFDNSKELYYFHAVDSKNKGYFGARIGKFTISGNSYFGRYDQGYVVRGTHYSSGVLYRANNNGVLQLGATLNGIDISSWQAGINIARVDADFVIVKATGGTKYVNPAFKTQAKQTLASGKLLGIYHFARESTSAGTAVAEAKHFLKTIKGYEKKAILVLDWEAGALAQGTAYAKTWLDYVYKQTGVRPMIYMSRYPTIEYDWSKVAPNYRLWVAEYATPRATSYTQHPWSRNGLGYGAWQKPTMFQYTDSGRINGYGGNLDLDLFYGGKALWNTIARKG